MKRISSIVLAIVMALALAACGNNTNNNNNSNGAKEVNMTAQEVLDSIKKSLGDSFDCDVTEDESRMSGYWGLDMTKVESWDAMSNSNSSLNPSSAVILKVQEGYAQDAAALLQSGYEQVLSYSRMYNMDLQKVLQARLFVNGNYVALLTLGAQCDWGRPATKIRPSLPLAKPQRLMQRGAAYSAPPITPSLSPRTTATATTSLT